MIGTLLAWVVVLAVSAVTLLVVADKMSQDDEFDQFIEDLETDACLEDPTAC
jgi:hypothetical protein